MSELLQMTLVELCDALRSKKASPVDLMKATLARVDETHDHLNAIVSRRDTDDLLSDARQAEARIAKGEARPLEGIPLGVKDLEDVEGLVTSHGSLPFKDHVAKEDSTQVARLKAAGAIAFGKTNAPEFGYTAITKNLVYGVTRSPWNPEHTPGGSSGGSAALMAAEAMPLVTSSDGGGSVRIPASFTGCFGLKPSYGRVPRSPYYQWDYDVTSTYGATTKTVEDAALFMDQVVGPALRDPWSLPHPGYSYADKLKEPLGKLKIAYSPDLTYAVVQSDVAAAVEEGVKVFEKLGHSVTRIDHGPPELGATWGLIGAWQLGSRLSELLPSREGDFMKSLMEGINMARHITMEWWGENARSRMKLLEWVAALFDEYDLLITPTVPYDPPPARGPYPSETEGKKQRTASVASFTIPFNLSFNPAASVRAGLSKKGLPIGMQLVGSRLREDVCFQAALAFERERPWHPEWPMR